MKNIILLALLVVSAGKVNAACSGSPFPMQLTPSKAPLKVLSVDPAGLPYSVAFTVTGVPDTGGSDILIKYAGISDSTPLENEAHMKAVYSSLMVAMVTNTSVGISAFIVTCEASATRIIFTK